MRPSTIGKISTVLLVVLIIVLAWIKEEEYEFEVKGRVAGFSSNPYSVLIEHEKIDGFMDAMTMPFTVKDSLEIQSLEIGQAIQFKYYVKLEEGISYIHSIQDIDDSLVARSGEIAFDLGLASSDAQKFVQIGDKLPNYSLIDQDGNQIRMKIGRAHV